MNKKQELGFLLIDMLKNYLVLTEKERSDVLIDIEDNIENEEFKSLLFSLMDLEDEYLSLYIVNFEKTILSLK